MSHVWWQNVPRKQIPLKCQGQNIFIQVRTTEPCVLTTTCFTDMWVQRCSFLVRKRQSMQRWRICSTDGIGRKLGGCSPVPCVLSHSCSNAITNVLPSTLDQKGGWQDNDVTIWKNAYSPNTLSELYAECKSTYNPRWKPGNEWHWELDLTCTRVSLKRLRNTLNQGIELD